MRTKRLTTMAILTALAAVLSWVERLIPLEMLIPLPGVKLGLANTVTMFALYRLDMPAAWLILIARCLLGTLLGGNVTGLAFSVTGAVFAMFAMAAGKRTGKLSVYGVSVLGAEAHAAGQILVAWLMMNTGAIIGYLPYLMLIGIVCGCLTAAVASGVLRTLRITDQEQKTASAGRKTE